MRQTAITTITTVAALIALWSPAVRSAPETYRVDPAKSTVTIAVGKSGALSFVAGHTHEVVGPIASGTVDVDRQHLSDARVRLVIAAAQLKVSPAHEPPDDVPKIQETMDGDQVLAVERYRDLIFESTAVSASGSGEASADLTIDGKLTIRGVAQPVRAPVHVSFAGDALTATGHFTVKQSAFGIKPVTVAGVVSVKDALDVRFSIAANTRPPAQ